MSTRAEHNSTWSVIVPADGTCAATWRENGDFGMSPIYGQLSDKPRLAFAYSHGVPGMKHKRDEKLNAEHPPAVRRAAGL
jgi:hypothetical protein